MVGVRKAAQPDLAIWMNGERVGTWSRSAAGVDVLVYDESWLHSPHARPLSLTLPFLPGSEPHRGEHVGAWFENLLPDTADIRQRVARRFGVANNPRSLLGEIGRDCVGAVQILPLGQAPGPINELELEQLETTDVARILRTVTSDAARLDEPTSDFRISIAGAQEKTALVQIDGRWYSPHGSTPTTHILKLPLGIVGNLRLDLASSIENEWLCLQILRELGLDVASAEVTSFRDAVSEERALVVKRFDRQWTHENRRLIRLPQEDMCQATGTRSANKYESDLGPGITQILEILRGGTSPATDIRLFVLAQLACWLLAAIDGHAKNYSIFLTREGYSLTPLYDVMSAWPIIGHGPNKLPIQRAKLAMAIKCKNRHYEIEGITTRHWRCLAEQGGIPFGEMEALVQNVPAAMDRISNSLPPTFPENVWLPIVEGVTRNAARFTAGISAT